MTRIKQFISNNPKFSHICLGLLITALLVGVKLIFERSPVGHRVELLTFELLQGRLTGIDTNPLPVVVLDISAIPGGTAGETTPRDSLKGLIAALTTGNNEARVKAIGLDIDFSPGLQGLQSEDEDLEFFDFCLNERSKVPIFLGVHRTVSSPADTWLGHEDYIPLAAAIYADPAHTSRLPIWFKQLDRPNEVLPAFGAALAAAHRRGELPAPPWWIRPFVSRSHELKIHLEGDDDKSALVSERLINYSKLELLQQTAIPVKDAAGISQILELLNNKVVILGRVRDATDRFSVPGRDGTVAGVFLHANAAYTFIKEPLFELSLGFRLVLDFLISLLILVLVVRVRFRKSDVVNTEWHQQQKKYTLVATLLVFGAGLFLVKYASIMWLDFVPLIAALLLHPWLEKRLEPVTGPAIVSSAKPSEAIS